MATAQVLELKLNFLKLTQFIFNRQPILPIIKEMSNKNCLKHSKLVGQPIGTLILSVVYFPLEIFFVYRIESRLNLRLSLSTLVYY